MALMHMQMMKAQTGLRSLVTEDQAGTEWN